MCTSERWASESGRGDKRESPGLQLRNLARCPRPLRLPPSERSGLAATRVERPSPRCQVTARRAVPLGPTRFGLPSP